MNSLRDYQQKLAAIKRLWEKQSYDRAMVKVEELRQTWPGNTHLMTLWASLVQLQENPTYTLAEAKAALLQAVEFDKSYVEAALELAHFLDAIEDNPQAAVKVYADGIATARQQLLEGLIGQAKAYLQLDKHEKALRCLMEVLDLLRFEAEDNRCRFEDQVKELLEDFLPNKITLSAEVR